MSIEWWVLALNMHRPKPSHFSGFDSQLELLGNCSQQDSWSLSRSVTSCGKLIETVEGGLGVRGVCVCVCGCTLGDSALISSLFSSVNSWELLSHSPIVNNKHLLSVYYVPDIDKLFHQILI